MRFFSHAALPLRETNFRKKARSFERADYVYRKIYGNPGHWLFSSFWKLSQLFTGRVLGPPK